MELMRDGADQDEFISKESFLNLEEFKNDKEMAEKLFQALAGKDDLKYDTKDENFMYKILVIQSFVSLDKNKNGWLSKTELKKMYQEKGELDKMMKLFDLDRDGIISMFEYVNQFAAEMKKNFESEES
jgi:Ca2+-binding EF-hand superfamily protein